MRFIVILAAISALIVACGATPESNRFAVKRLDAHIAKHAGATNGPRVWGLDDVTHNRFVSLFRLVRAEHPEFFDRAMELTTVSSEFGRRPDPREQIVLVSHGGDDDASRVEWLVDDEAHRRAIQLVRYTALEAPELLEQVGFTGNFSVGISIGGTF